jgi:hypothetical protein
MTDDELKMKPSEVAELQRMDVIEFYQYLNIYSERLEKKIAASGQGNTRTPK